MYTEFFGLTEKPFSITPDPRYLYMSARHADALAHLIYGISESGGFIQLTGEVGTGKTTLIRSLLEQLPEKAEIALILNPQLSAREFLEVICEELGTAPPRADSVKERIDALNSHLLERHAAGKRVVLIVDEAQTLSPELLEQVRLLTNLETAKQKLLQIILIGQPELRDLLGRPEMRQIAQRVTGRYHLEPLSKEDTAAYIRHRMRVAGAQSDVFKASGVRRLYSSSRGIPRLINVVADRALLAAYTQDRHGVDGKLIARAAAEVFGTRRPGGRWWPWAAVALGLASFALATTNLLQRHREPAGLGVEQAPRAAEASLAGAPATGPGATEPAFGGTPPAAAAPAESLTLAELLRDPDFRTDRDGAVGTLLALWGAAYDPAEGDACHQAEQQGLRCLPLDRGSLFELRRVNWPTILPLVDEQGVQHHVVITALGYDAASVLANGKMFKLPLAELAYSWYGDQLLLWRPLIAQPLTPGMRDADVLWLRATLARIHGEEPPADGSPLYDRALENAVRRYQRERMLTVDGIVGARTQVALVADLDVPGTPSLIEEN
ncbi:MAG TPA: AAA family ATPase [Gammaproteobacteria bacterium]|nr:AAA family ATPase [Gammaproteobacteria bacterium]